MKEGERERERKIVSEKEGEKRGREIVHTVPTCTDFWTILSNASNKNLVLP